MATRGSDPRDARNEARLADSEVQVFGGHEGSEIPILKIERRKMSNMSNLDSNVHAMAGVLSNHKVSIETGIGDYWDDCDPWGSAMAQGFALCDWLYFDCRRSDLIPEALGYRPGCGSEDDDMLLGCVREAYPAPSDDDAQHVSGYLQILSDFLDLCRAGGLDY